MAHVNGCLCAYLRGTKMHDVEQYKTAKQSEETAKSGTPPTDMQMSRSLKSSELAKYCRTTTRVVKETRQLISSLIE